jgi:RNA polymerase sigma factor (sigma-70 family)
MRRINACLEFDNFTDNQLLKVMLTNDEAHSCIYLQHKSYCIKFLKKRGASENDALDIYQDATIVLYENNRNPKFRLTCSIQTYLNSVCYNQLLAKGKSNYSTKVIHTDDIDENIKDWFEEESELVDSKIERLLNEFENMKANRDKCYERLRLFYYDNLSMTEIALNQGLTNADNAKNQINRCRNQLKQLLRV